MRTPIKQSIVALASISLLFASSPAYSAPVKDVSQEYIVSVQNGHNVSKIFKELSLNGTQILDANWLIKSANVTVSESRKNQLERKYKGQIEFHPNIDIKIAQTQTPAPWGIDRIDQLSLPLSSSFTSNFNGSGVDIYVLDTGIRTDHAEFQGRLKPGYSNVNDGVAMTDCSGHGTHVAGTAAGSTYGVAKGANIIPVRIIDCSNGTDAFGLSDGINWIIAHHQAGVPAVVNMSLGGQASTFIDGLVKLLEEDGIVVVAAAGNEATNACNVSPARSEHVLAVAASLIDDSHAWYSNRGSCVDIYAPGGGDGSQTNPAILSAGISSPTAAALSSGTSMAAPHVAGVAAVYLSSNPTATPSQVKSALLNAATPVVLNVPSGTTNKLVQLTSLAIPTTPTEPAPTTPTEPAPTTPTEPAPEIVVPEPEIEEPKQPTAVQNFQSNLISRSAMRISWTAPEKNGGSSIVSYRIAIYDAASNKLLRSFVQKANRTSATIGRTANISKIYVSIQAANANKAAGDNFISPILEFPSPPSAVTGLNSTQVSKGVIQLAWNPVESPNVWYEVRVSRTNSARSWNSWHKISGTSIVIAGLPSNLQRFVEIRAVNPYGASPIRRVEVKAS